MSSFINSLSKKSHTALVGVASVALHKSNRIIEYFENRIKFYHGKLL